MKDILIAALVTIIGFTSVLGFAVGIRTSQCRKTVEVFSAYFEKDFQYKYHPSIGCMLSEDGVKFIPVSNIKVEID